MSEATRVLVPLVNPNETEARLVDLHIKEGQQVNKGAVLATLETTKSTFELNAEEGGFVAGLRAQAGEVLRAGELFCYLAEDRKWKAPKSKKAEKEATTRVPEGLRITRPALALAQEKGLDLSRLPIGPIVTEEGVRKALSATGKAPAFKAPKEASESKAVIVFGGGGHGKAVIDLLQAVGGYRLIGVVDDGLEAGGQVLGVPVLGGGEATLGPLGEAGCKLAVNAVGGIGAMSSRIAIFERLEQAGFDFPTLVHPSAVVESSAKLAAGVQVFPQAYVGSAARVGRGCILNTSTIVSHDCELAEYANLSPGAILAGGVRVGEGVLIGMGTTVNLNVRIGARARIGNSAVVKEDVPAGAIVRAGAVWPAK